MTSINTHHDDDQFEIDQDAIEIEENQSKKQQFVNKKKKQKKKSKKKSKVNGNTENKINNNFLSDEESNSAQIEIEYVILIAVNIILKYSKSTKKFL